MNELGYQDEDDEEEETEEKEVPRVDAVGQALLDIKAQVSDKTWSKVMEDLQGKARSETDYSKVPENDAIDAFNDGDVKYEDLPQKVQRRVSGEK
ncbi:hypothetical protein LCGC14_2108430 [marine sediment metagenome]|uniref:Uncharacterized protein n=1 Tax=marine sediment metagenome TaxID=412755 RepID=A0A0F9GKZ4_9ZZZZ